MKKFFRVIHLWLALPAGIIIIILCLTGAILVFKDELLTLMGYESIRESPLMVIMKLHRWLMDDSRTVGKVIVGISTIFFVFILVSGLMAYRPRKWRKSHFVVSRGKSMNRLLFSLHTVLGLYVIPILLLCALTGLVWSFQWYRDLISFLFSVEIERGAPVWKIIRALHFGSYAGMFSKVITCIASLIGASLPVTGYWLYVKKRRRTEKG